MSDIKDLQDELRKIHEERDWDQFHNPKDLLIALVSEVGELADCYRWLNEEELKNIHNDPEKKKEVEGELADIMMFLLILSRKANVDLTQAVRDKIEKVKKRYPIEKSKGIHSNRFEGFKG